MVLSAERQTALGREANLMHERSHLAAQITFP